MTTWRPLKVAHTFKIIGSGTTPPSENAAYYDGDVPWVTSSELRETTISTTKQCLSRNTLIEFPALRIFPSGSIVIAMYGATIGRMGILGIPSTVNQACCVLAASDEVEV
jgi:type I restriction enzyme S subunit